MFTSTDRTQWHPAYDQAGGIDGDGGGASGSGVAGGAAAVTGGGGWSDAH